MKNKLIDRMSKEKDSYGYSHRHLAQYIITHHDEVPDMTISVLAKKAYCSPSSVSRLVTKLGFDSYYSFCSELRKKDAETVIDVGIITSFVKAENAFIEQSDKTQQLINDFISANKVYILATGSSIVPALDFERKYRRNINKKIIFSPLFEEQARYVSEITESDLVLVVSNSGESRELVLLSSQLNSFTLITNRKNSKLAKLSTTCISLENHIEALNDFKDKPRESKYSLIHFFDIFFEQLLNSLED